MKPDFSEFSFGFALTREICAANCGDMRAAPVMPSLIDEGQAGGGYDVFVDQPGHPLYLQFKISERMVRSTAAEWDEFDEPYYRFWIHAGRHSAQHELLLQLDIDPNAVYYAAPAFHTVGALNRAFLDEVMFEQTAFFRPRDLGPMPDRDAHVVAFRPEDHHGVRCSDERARVRVDSTGRGLITRYKESTAREEVLEPEAYFSSIADQLMKMVAPEPLDGMGKILERPARIRAAYLSRMILGAELLWLTELEA